MKPAFLWGAALAVGLVLAVLVSGLAPGLTGTAGTGPAAAPSPAPFHQLYGPTLVPATADYTASRAALESTAYSIAIREGLDPAEAKHAASLWATATPEEIRAAGSCLGPVCIPWNLPPWQDGIAAAGGGCIAGVAVTAALSVASSVTIVGPAIVSGFACAVGASAAYLGLTAGYNIGRGGLPKQVTQYVLWSGTLGSSVYGQSNLTGATYGTLQSSVNFSAIAFQRMADHAALYQLGNSTFDLGLDEGQSGLASQFGTLLTEFDIQSSRQFGPLASAFEAQGAPGSLYASTNPAMTFPNGATWSAQSATSFYLKYAGPTIGSSNGVDGNFWIPAYSNLTFECSGSEVEFKSLVGNDAYFYNITGSIYTLNFTHTDGLWNVTSTGSCQMTYPFGARLIYSTAHGGDLIAGSSVRYAYQLVKGSNAAVNCGGTVSSQEIDVGSASTIQLGYFGSPSGGSCGVETVSTPVVPLYSYGVGQSLESQYGDAMLSAALNGEAYWSFLRSLGYTSVSQIPADCEVPAPYQVMPASYQANYVNMTQAQLQSLYLGWLAAMGRFYNTSLNGIQFCGNTAKQQFHLGGANWGGIFVNATGSIYLNNGTGPVNGNGTALPSEKYGNLSTWAVAKSQLYLMPELGSIGIPVGKVWNIPINNPIQVYAISTGQFLTLYGNGTCVDTKILPCVDAVTGSSGPNKVGNLSYACAANKTPTANCYQAPGNAIYLTSCTVGGSATNTCAVTVSTVNATMANLTCGTACTSRSATSGGSGGFSFGNPFAGFTNWLASLFGGGPFAQAVAGILTLVGVLVVIGAAIWLTFDYLDRKAKGAT